MIANPKVTVLMPVYNGASFLEQAINSVLGQTFTDFELLIINDGSTDISQEIIDRFNDKRIRVIHQKENRGLISTLNSGILEARCNLVARMDADDISYSTRLEKQTDFLTKHPDVDVLGCHIDIIDERNTILYERSYCTDHASIKVESFFCCPLPHPGVIFKRDKFLNNGLLYDPLYTHAEDYELWQRALNVLKFACCNEKLLGYRISSGQVSSSYRLEQRKASDLVKLNYLRSLQTPALNNYDLILEFLNDDFSVIDREVFGLLLDQLDELIVANSKLKLFEPKLFNKILSTKTEQLIRKNKSVMKGYSVYQKHQLYLFTSLSAFGKLKMQYQEWLT